MSILTRIKAFFSQFISDFLSPLAQVIALNGGKLLIDAATKAVLAAEATGGTGAQKFEAAEKAVLRELRNAGIPAAKNAVRGAIEAAVAKYL